MKTYLPRLYFIFTLLLAAMMAILPSISKAADDYPNKPIRLVVPFSAGGQFDFVGRLISKSMSDSLHQSIIVENVGGAGGTIGGAKVAATAPDGYTILQYGGNFTIAKYLFPNLSFDPLTGLSPVAAISIAPHVIIAKDSLPVKTFAELVAYSKTHPGKLSYGTPGVGTSMHLTFEEIKEHFGLDIVHVPYRGGSNVMNDIAGGQIDVAIVAVGPALPFVQAGKIKALAVTSEARSPSLPEVPSIAEQGFPGFDRGSWAGLVVPKGTPDAIVSRLNKAVQTALLDPKTQQELHAQSFTTLPGTPKQFQDLIQQEAERYGPLLERLGLKAN